MWFSIPNLGDTTPLNICLSIDYYVRMFNCCSGVKKNFTLVVALNKWYEYYMIIWHLNVTLFAIQITN